LAFLKLGYDDLPVLDIEGTTILGFDTEAIENALKEKEIARVGLSWLATIGPIGQNKVHLKRA
jgi:hypothetical protein